jgi:phospholipid N-methyltransferase
MTMTAPAATAPDRVRFLRSFLAHPRQVGAVVPTSRGTVSRLLDMADVPGAACVVELGAGTGVFTAELLRRIGSGARLVTFEIDAELAGALEARFDDERLEVVADSAETLLDRMGGRQAEVVVSALPFTSLPASVRTRVFRGVTEVLAPGGALLAIQYSKVRRRELAEWFRRIESRRSIRNVPPAVLFACREPRW